MSHSFVSVHKGYILIRDDKMLGSGSNMSFVEWFEFVSG